MKKILAMLLFAAGITGTTYAQDTKENQFVNKKVVLEQEVYNLVVNDDISVVFTDEFRKEITIEGRDSEVKKVTLTEQNGILEISAPASFLTKKKVVVYVPARGLRSVTINGASVVHSYDKIQNPHINVFVNGSCQIRIKTYGKIKVINSDEYSYTYQSKKLAD